MTNRILDLVLIFMVFSLFSLGTFAITNIVAVEEQKEESTEIQKIEKEIEKKEKIKIVKKIDEELNYNLDDFFSKNLKLKSDILIIFNGLSHEEKIGMLLMPAYEEKHNKKDLEKWIKEYKIGGLLILKNTLKPEEIKELKKNAEHSLSENNNIQLPFLVSADAEPSLIKYRFPELKVLNTDKLTKENIFEESNKIFSHLNKSGINLNFAPVYDSNQNKEVIKTRSFGSDLNAINLANLFSNYSKNKNIIPTAKHFPGHGNVVGDSHKMLPYINGELIELNSFQKAIENKIPLIMIGHLAIKNNEIYSTDGLPATISKKIITDLLKTKMKFNGIVISDALNMQATDNIENIEVKALKAGIDILLIPRGLEIAQKKILKEMSENENFRNEIDKKVLKIIKLKKVLELSQNYKE